MYKRKKGCINARSLFGFDSFAGLNIDSEMACTCDRVDKFLHDLINCSKSKYLYDVDLLKNNLPDNVFWIVKDALSRGIWDTLKKTIKKD